MTPKTRLRSLVLSVVASVAFTAPAWSLCLQTPGDDRGTEVYRFTVALVDSFSHAKSGMAKVSNAQAGSGPFEQLTQLMYELKLAAEDYNCAAEAIAEYTKSMDEKVSLGAKAAHLSYQRLIALDTQQVELLKQALDSAFEVGSMAEKVADIRVKVDASWRGVILAAIATTHVLVAMPTRSGEKLSTLRITAEQRKTVAEKIEQVFGQEVRGGLKAGQIPLTAAAATLYAFVSDANWKSSDSKIE